MKLQYRKTIKSELTKTAAWMNQTAVLSACQKVFDRLVDGGTVPPPQPPLYIFQPRPLGTTEKCKEAIFSSGKWDFPLEKSLRSRRTRRRDRLNSLLDAAFSSNNENRRLDDPNGGFLVEGKIRKGIWEFCLRFGGDARRLQRGKSFTRNSIANECGVNVVER